MENMVKKIMVLGIYLVLAWTINVGAMEADGKEGKAAISYIVTEGGTAVADTGTVAVTVHADLPGTASTPKSKATTGHIRHKSSMQRETKKSISKEEKALEELLAQWEIRMSSFIPVAYESTEDSHERAFAHIQENKRAQERYAKTFAKDFHDTEFTQAIRKKDGPFHKACNECSSLSAMESKLNDFLKWHNLRDELEETPRFTRLTNRVAISQDFKIGYRRYNIRLLFGDTNSKIVMKALLTNPRTEHLFSERDILNKIDHLSQAAGNSSIIEELIPMIKAKLDISDDEKLPRLIQEHLRRVRHAAASHSVQRVAAHHGRIDNKSMWDVKTLMAHKSSSHKDDSKAVASTHQTMGSQGSTQTMTQIGDDSCCCDNCCCITCCTLCDCCDCWKSLWRKFKSCCCIC